MKIALYLPNWIGDAVMATPALRALRKQFATAEVVAILRPPVQDVIAGLGLVDRILPHEPHGEFRERRGGGFLRKLKDERFDLAVLFTNSLRTAWNAWRSGARRRVGFARDGRSLFLTDRLVPKSRTVPNPVLDEYLRLAKSLGCDVTDRRTLAAIVEADERELSRFWRQFDASWPSAGIVCLNPGGAFGAAKHWPTEKFAELARRIVDHLGRTVLVLCGPAERPQAREIVRLSARNRVVSFADFPTGLGLTKAAIRSAEILVTTDSGPRHFAQPFGVPVVTLFGPTHPAWSATGHPDEATLQLKIDCGPCQQRTCPLKHHLCMRDLSTNWVFDVIARRLLRKGRKVVA
jgi:heptosyltransferase-2